MERDSKVEARDVLCGACGARERAGETHRRGRCARCYEQWVRARPVGLGAACAGCGDRRHDDLRHFELHGTWVVLCHGCSARADTMAPLPRTVAGLRLRLARERRWGDRRAEAVSGTRKARAASERRAGDRRDGQRGVIDVTEYAEMMVELEAEFSDPAEDQDPMDGPITGVHRLIEPVDL